MKKYIVLLLFLAMANHAMSQVLSSGGVYQIVALKAKPINVCWDKTTVLIFPSEILSVDRGSKAVLAQKDASAINLLKLKAGQKDFVPTNLHVVTADGLIHSFDVSYKEILSESTYDFTGSGRNLAKFGHGPSEQDFFATINNILKYPSSVKKKAIKNGIGIYLLDIFQSEGILYFHFELENRNEISFSTKGPEIFIRDAKQRKRTSVREIQLSPVHSFYENGKVLEKENPKTVVIALKQFTISDRKHLVFNLKELEGDRNPVLKIKGRQLLKAKKLTHVQPII